MLTKVRLVKAMVYPVVMFGWKKEMATHSSVLAWRIPWTEEPGGLQPMGSQEPNMTERPSSAQHSRFMFNLVRNFQTNF